jgi:hypothetical protein
MSYDFHMVRSKEKPITNEEWNALVESEPGEWRFEKELSATNPRTKEVITRQKKDGMLFTIWLGNPKRSPHGVVFDLGSGRVNISGHAIDTPDASDRTFAKILAVAKKLGAQVVGDEGEVATHISKICAGDKEQE